MQFILITEKGGGGKKLGLYDSAINIRIISYLLTKKEKKWKEKGNTCVYAW
jgi:hypothetical protein